MLKTYARFICLVFLAALVAFAPSCTVTPGTVWSSETGYNGGNRDSGFLGFNEDGSGRLSSGARGRFNALVRLYGNRFLVPLKEDGGLTPGPVLLGDQTYTIDAEHLVKFQTMNRWHRSGFPPATNSVVRP